MILYDALDNDIEIVNVTRFERLSSSSASLGNQIKWKHGNKYIKLNCLGYEDIAEVLTSRLLTFSNLDSHEYVMYYSCRIVEDGKFLGFGCYSYDFVEDNIEVTVSSILDNNLASYAISYENLRDLLYDVVGFDTKPYIDKILSVDSLILNEDRHFKNISFLFDGEIYRPAPIFDNGAGCLSDLISYPMSVDLQTNLKSVYAKPFSIHFGADLKSNTPLVIDYNSFISAMQFTDEKSLRALEVIKFAMKQMEGISWVRC